VLPPSHFQQIWRRKATECKPHSGRCGNSQLEEQRGRCREALRFRLLDLETQIRHGLLLPTVALFG
jgi:hypothetical protein